MTWTSVGAGVMTWQCLEERKEFLSASAFNLYYRYYRLYISPKPCIKLLNIIFITFKEIKLYS
jgi:hypothetical protein